MPSSMPDHKNDLQPHLLIVKRHADLPNVQHLQLDPLPEHPRLLSSLSGIVLLGSGAAAAGWQLTVVGAHVPQPVRWGLPSPKLAEMYPENPRAGSARFKADGLEIKEGVPVRLLLSSPSGEVQELLRISETGPLSLQDNPFFIIGCVRSGTTLVRDILRRHPNLAAPEETQFFRFAEPFAAGGLGMLLSTNPVLKRHREMDGIEESEFQEMLSQSLSRADLYWRYMTLYVLKNKPTAKRWFDKSPQNVYGAAMIAAELPTSKFIHIVRDPRDVVASLRIGKIVRVASVVGACSYWNEAVEIMNVLKMACPERVYEVKYEDFAREPVNELKKILAFLGEDFDPLHYRDLRIEPKKHEHAALFSEGEMLQIARLCKRWGTQYGYFEDHAENRDTGETVVQKRDNRGGSVS